MSDAEQGRKLLTVVPPVPEAWVRLGLAPSQDSSQGPVTTPICQVRDIKVTEAASQGRRLKKGSGPDPPLRQSPSATPRELSTGFNCI